MGGVYGDGLGKYGRARCKLAIVSGSPCGHPLTPSLTTRRKRSSAVGSAMVTLTGWVGDEAGVPRSELTFPETSLAAVNDYKTFRKKLESRR